jgi:hypothetical protein
MISLAPSATKSLAVARPIPLVPPVINAFLPDSLFPIFTDYGFKNTIKKNGW